jgi:hypothetical protein
MATPQEILDDASCFACLGEKTLQTIQTQLLAELLSILSPTTDVTPQAILDRASCFACLPSGTLQVIVATLLNEIYTSGGLANAVYLADDVADLRAQATRYQIIRIPSLGHDYNWVADSTTADNGVTVLKPDDLGAGDPGRYEQFI